MFITLKLNFLSFMDHKFLNETSHNETISTKLAHIYLNGLIIYIDFLW